MLSILTSRFPLPVRRSLAFAAGLTGALAALSMPLVALAAREFRVAHAVGTLVGAVALLIFLRLHLGRLVSGAQLLPGERVAGWVAILAGLFCIALTRAAPAAAWSGIALTGAFILAKSFAALPHPAAAAQDPASGGPSPVLLDNLSGLLFTAVVIVLAYCYGVEAFRIPTGSMEPTLYGHEMWGDRTLVNKLSFAFREPERGEICAFRFPLNRSTPYVKRAAAFAGETVLIAQGDVYVQGRDEAWPRIWRKTGRMRDAMWLDLYEHSGGDVALRANFEGISGKASSDDGTLVLTPAADAPALLRYPRRRSDSDPRGGSITDHNPTGDVHHDGQYVHESVADLCVRFRLEGEAGQDSPAPAGNKAGDGGYFKVSMIRGDSGVALIFGATGRWIELSAPGGAAPERIALAALERAAALTLSPRDTLDVEFGVADGGIDLVFNGRALERMLFEPPLERFLRMRAEAGNPIDVATLEGRKLVRNALPDRKECKIELSAARAVRVSRFAIDRDIHYLGVRVVERLGESLRALEGPTVPYGHRVAQGGVFMLGDNSEMSLDSRLWYAADIELVNGERHRAQLEFLFDGMPPGVRENTKTYWALRATHTLLGLDAMESPGDMDRALTAAIRAGAFGQRLRILDEYGIVRETAATGVRNIHVQHVPEMPADLLMGPLLLSAAPKPRFID